MLLRVFTSRSLCLNDPSKPFVIWACGFKQGSRLGNVQEPVDELREDVSQEKRKGVKNCYVPHPDVLARSEEEILKFRNDNEMKIKGAKPCPRPIFKIEEANFPPYITDKLRKQNFTEPTPIQSQSWPIALQGGNMVGIARTGSGKTLAYLLPSIIRINEQKKENPRVRGPLSLVMAPTRELAVQIKSVADVYRDSVKSVAVYGGASRLNQESLLREAPNIIIATPGRLLDFLRSRVISLDQCSYIVLDEADRMLDMGFEPQIREVMDQTESDKQVLMWSATWPKEIRSLAEDYLKDYIHLTVGSEELTANPNIKQVIQFCTKFDKVHNLLEFLKTKPQQRTLIFTESKRAADELRLILTRKGLRTTSIHGDKSQAARESALNAFRGGRVDIMIATDVAARGLDVDDIEYVVNFELPKTIESYIHRIGRTARHEKKGTAFSLMTDEDTCIAKDLIDILKKCNQEVPQELLALAPSSVRINFRDRYAPREGFKKSGGFSSRRDGNSFRNRNSYDNSYRDRNSFDSRRRRSDESDSWEDDFNFEEGRRSSNKGRRSSDSFDSFGEDEFELTDRRSNNFGRNRSGGGGDFRNQRRSRDDDSW